MFTQLINGSKKPEKATKNGDVDDVLHTHAELELEIPSTIKTLRPEIVGESLASKICPAVLMDNSYVLFVVPEFRHHEMTETTVARCKEISKSKKIETFVITSTLLLGLRDKGTTQRDNRAESKSAYKGSFEEIVRWGLKNNASDIHFNINHDATFSHVKFSIDGSYTAPKTWRLETNLLLNILNVAWMEGRGGHAPIFTGDSEQQCSIRLNIDKQDIICRWASLATDHGPSVTIRLLKTDQQFTSKSLESQGYLPSQIAMFERAQLSEGGAIFLAGVVGSGKSTTIASLLSSIPDSRKIITLEDPVEYRIPNALQNTISRSLEGNDENAFGAKLKTVKRSAPDELLIGEIRDDVTGQAFIDVTGSGTNVYTTVHAKSDIQIPERLASKAIGIPLDFLGSPGILNLLVFQALLPVLCDKCSHPIEETFSGWKDGLGIKRSGSYWREYTQRIVRLFDTDLTGLRIRNQSGCNHCSNPEMPALNGYKGRTVAAEMIAPNTDREVLRMIRSGDTIGLQEYKDTLQKTDIRDVNMDNKSIIENAMYKAYKGIFDVRDIERKTMSFETLELIRNSRANSGQRLHAISK